MLDELIEVSLIDIRAVVDEYIYDKVSNTETNEVKEKVEKYNKEISSIEAYLKEKYKLKTETPKESLKLYKEEVGIREEEV